MNVRECCTINKGKCPMKTRHLPPTCINMNRAPLPPPANVVLAAALSSERGLVRHQAGTMGTKDQPVGAGFSAWNLRALWGSLKSLVKRGKSDFHTATPVGQGRASVVPTRIALRTTATLPAKKQCLSPTRIDGGHVLRSTGGRHLWLVLRSEENRRGALWETAGFLAIWLSGLIGVAICVL